MPGIAAGRRIRLPAAGILREPLLGADVPLLLCVEVELCPAFAGSGSDSLGELDSVDEPLAGRPQCELRIDVHDARQVDDGEKEVSELGEHEWVGLRLRRGPTAAGELGLDLRDLLAHLGERPLDVGPVESDRGRSALHLARVKQAGEGLRYVVEDA